MNKEKTEVRKVDWLNLFFGGMTIWFGMVVLPLVDGIFFALAVLGMLFGLLAIYVGLNFR